VVTSRGRAPADAPPTTSATKPADHPASAGRASVPAPVGICYQRCHMRLRSNFPRRTEPTTRALGRALALLVLGLSTLTLGSTLGACEQQGEGERCEIANGDADCAAGLVCKSASELGGETDYCCPASGSANPVCIPGGNTGGSGTGGGGTGGGGTGGTGGGGGRHAAARAARVAAARAASAAAARVAAARVAAARAASAAAARAARVAAARVAAARAASAAPAVVALAAPDARAP
jgi:hypothetical protein